MSYMQAQMTNKRKWLMVDGPMGVEYVDLEDVGALEAKVLVEQFRVRTKLASFGHLADYFENREVWTAEIVTGYGVRSSAPGYMDATPWVVYASLREARRALAEEKRALRDED